MSRLAKCEMTKAQALKNFEGAEKIAFAILDALDPTLVVSAEDRSVWDELKDEKKFRKKHHASAACDVSVSRIYHDLCVAIDKQYEPVGPSPVFRSANLGGKELLDRLHEKMAEASSARTSSKPKGPKQKTEVKRKRAPLAARQPRAKHESNAAAKVPKHKQQDDAENEDDENGPEIQYVKFDLHDGMSGGDHRKKKHGGGKIREALNFARSEKSKTDQAKWKIALQKASGEKIVPDEKLKHLLKAKQSKKKRSAKDWMQRKEQVALKRKAYDEKRKANLNKRKENKLLKKRKRFIKKGHIV